MSIAIAAACFTATAPAVAGGLRIVIGNDGGYYEGGKKGLYDGCSTKKQIFRVVKKADAEPKRIVGQKGPYVYVRAYSYDDEALFDYVVDACDLYVDGRFPVEKKKKPVEEKMLVERE